MSGPKRFYLPHYTNQPDRPVYIEDVGNLLKISGLILQGMGSTMFLFSPNGDIPQAGLILGDPSPNIVYVKPSLEEWGEIIRISDDPLEFVGEVGGINKVLHRKQRNAISGNVQQKIWVRDGLKCVYCSTPMGQALLTVDHFMPLELGGVNDETNYVSSCRKCNKRKGMMHPKDFCGKYGFNYELIANYLEELTLPVMNDGDSWVAESPR